ncbi:MAG: SUMF1/EgtB/PvdO family nonheme iron enzyme [Muribaculaceae bacterium]|nr:SUMF1/EgtB/PvdO family nonheme iron enzyme [Muribaculaceae bacterium]
MIKRFFITIGLCVCAICAQAQLTVANECTLQQQDITAYRLNDQHPVVSEYGDTIPFALLRVGLAEPNVTFEGPEYIKHEYKEEDGEYWVYVMDGARQSLTIKSRRFTPLRYKFPEPLKAKSTYTMAIHKPDGEKYKGTLVISSNVKTADVYVDGVKVSDGTPFSYVGDGGAHHIELRAEGYDSQAREVEVLMGQVTNVTINLFAEGSLNVDGVGYGMVSIGATTFMMGSGLNYYTLPQRNVKLKPFYAGSTLVSVDLWQKVMGSADDRVKGSHGEVVNVSYDEVMDFISTLNQLTGKEFRLPTEAEWECLAKNSAKYGISDITSTMEWCSDWFGRYSLSDTSNPQGPESGILRVVRGGAEYDDSDATYSDLNFRWRKQPYKGSPRISFRLVSD